ncbi:hypothetical protein BKA70DRAFT_1226888 [Coprinopsis sp. MPI-PUGE-AT-0042]|nr:hypothetical protein BKA70DRAFT_1226888 [Coprinopsis sp. MPI-PUGE-AT-0042]
MWMRRGGRMLFRDGGSRVADTVMRQMQGYATCIGAMNQQALVPPAPAAIATFYDAEEEASQQPAEEKVEPSSGAEEDQQADGEHGLSGGGPGHMQLLQSPVLHPHPGGHPVTMMSPHLGGGFNGFPPPSPFAGPGSSTMSNFRPMTPATHGAIPNTEIGMANGEGLQHHASPLRMASCRLRRMQVVLGQQARWRCRCRRRVDRLARYHRASRQRGRKGWQSAQTRSRPSAMVGGGEFDEVERAPQEGSERGDAEDNVLDDEDEEGGGLNPLLADAILKRSSSIRMNSKRSTSNLAGDSVVGLLRSVSMPGMANGGDSNHQEQLPFPREKHYRGEVEEEFTFPSLSELGHVAREKRVPTPALADGEKNSSSMPRLVFAMSSLVAGEGSAKTTNEEEHHIPSCDCVQFSV